MQKGKRPVPAQLRLLQGGAKRDTDRAAEAPKPPAGDRPEPPVFLTSMALGEWDRVSDILWTMGVVSEIDTATLAAYCMAYARWVDAEEKMEDARQGDPFGGGLTIETSNGNVIQNPLVGIANVARREMLRFAAELGLTPAARMQIRGKAGGDDGAASKFFS